MSELENDTAALVDASRRWLKTFHGAGLWTDFTGTEAILDIEHEADRLVRWARASGESPGDYDRMATEVVLLNLCSEFAIHDWQAADAPQSADHFWSVFLRTGVDPGGVALDPWGERYAQPGKLAIYHPDFGREIYECRTHDDYAQVFNRALTRMGAEKRFYRFGGQELGEVYPLLSKSHYDLLQPLGWMDEFFVPIWSY